MIFYNAYNIDTLLSTEVGFGHWLVIGPLLVDGLLLVIGHWSFDAAFI